MNRQFFRFTSIFLFICFCITAGCTLLHRGDQATPEKLVSAYLEAFKEGDFDTMVMLSGGWEGTPEELEFTRNFVQMIELKSYAINKTEPISAVEALVEVTMTISLLGHEKLHNSTIRVEKKDGKWFLTGSILE